MMISMLLIIAGLLFPEVDKRLVFENATYEPQIKSVQVYNLSGQPARSHAPAVTPLGQNQLVLEFDDLQNDINSYYARLIHCNYNWTPSNLRDLDFMRDYNEFNVNDYVYSNNTYTPYVHYTFRVPGVKLPGNYLLVVYRDGNKSDLILSHRIMVFDSKTSLEKDNQLSGALTLRSTNQQLNFTVDYRGMEIVNPFQSVHVVVRQNFRWDKSRLDVQPSFVREERNQIEYRLFGDDKHFEAGNEFRFVDFRSLNFPGQNTAKIDKGSRPFHLWVQPDESREHQVYSQYPDINGQYRIENLDNGRDVTAADYAEVTFTLQSKEVPGKIYVMGEFNQWRKQNSNQMHFNTANQTYTTTLLLKQGWYNYAYEVESESLPSYFFEGSHYETENIYEVFFYYRPFQPNADLLIGYFQLPVNAR